MTNTREDSHVLVTGGSGFVGGYCLLQLLERGYCVKTTIRSLQKKEEVLQMLRTAGVRNTDRLSFIEADLTSDNNWNLAVADCAWVLHVASPIGLALPENEEETIRPAVEGTLRVLRAARDAGAKRVVMTSNFGAVGYSRKDTTTLITEEDWTNPEEPGLSVYNKSKVLAEKAAWEFIRREGGGLELAVINPVGIFGPSMSPVLSAGYGLLKKVMDGSMKRIPNITLGIVDVRDVADLHIRAMTSPQAAGQRFLALAGGVETLPGIAAMLKEALGTDGRKISAKRMPDWLVRVAALFSPLAKNAVPMLGMYRNASNEKARKLLGWQPRSNREALLATAECLLKYGK